MMFVFLAGIKVCINMTGTCSARQNCDETEKRGVLGSGSLCNRWNNSNHGLED
jgi:hypothetical protein